MIDDETCGSTAIFDYELDGPGSPFYRRVSHHETPTAAHPNPGRFALDDEDTDVNTLAALDDEEARLSEMFPGADVLATKEVRVFRSGESNARLRSVQWHVSVGYDGCRGGCFGNVDKLTLREACDAAASDFRAKLMDRQAPVALPAEGRAA